MLRNKTTSFVGLRKEQRELELTLLQQKAAVLKKIKRRAGCCSTCGSKRRLFTWQDNMVECIACQKPVCRNCLVESIDQRRMCEMCALEMRLDKSCLAVKLNHQDNQFLTRYTQAKEEQSELEKLLHDIRTCLESTTSLEHASRLVRFAFDLIKSLQQFAMFADRFYKTPQKQRLGKRVARTFRVYLQTSAPQLKLLSNRVYSAHLSSAIEAFKQVKDIWNIISESDAASRYFSVFLDASKSLR